MLQNEDYEVANLFYEGRPQNGIYAVRSLGVDPSTGREIFLDKDGNVTDEWKAGDKVYLGPGYQPYHGNFGTMVMWKGFTLNVSFNYYWVIQLLLGRKEIQLNFGRPRGSDDKHTDDI